MHRKIITFFKKHPKLLNFIRTIIYALIKMFVWMIPIKKNRMIFSSFGGRKFDDSPKAIYEKIVENKNMIVFNKASDLLIIFVKEFSEVYMKM